jgi:hypothetical protein
VAGRPWVYVRQTCCGLAGTGQAAVQQLQIKFNINKEGNIFFKQKYRIVFIINDGRHEYKLVLVWHYSVIFPPPLLQ